MRTIPTGQPATAPAPVAPQPITAAHNTDPALAAALFAAWSGDPAVVISSPPGAGKTRLITHLAAQLHHCAGLRVAIAAQTRAQALDVANRTAATGTPTALLTKTGAPRPTGLHPDIATAAALNLRGRSGVVIATTAKWLWTDTRAWNADVLLVDEAYQLTWADLGALAPLAEQIVMVGDPGQISPVVTGNTSRWDDWNLGPHRPAPDALLAAYPDDVTVQRLPHTWRLGPATTALIQPALYPNLPFTSARPARHLTTASGDQLPEYTATAIRTAGAPTDPTIAATGAALARDLLAATLHPHDGASRTLTAADVAVVVPHVAQAQLVAAHLTEHPDLLIGTANQMQGLEREAVVVIHPLTGYRTAPDFATDLGRLCVALTRHRTHVHVITDTATPDVLARVTTTAPTQDTAAQARILHALHKPMNI